MPHTCTKHEPGPACYRVHGCRCDECRTITNRHKKRTRTNNPDMVPTAPVRAHVLRLLASGYTLNAIAKAAGTNHTQLEYMLDTAKRCHRATAATILAVKAPPAGEMSSAGVRRRVHGLCRMGWTIMQIAAEAGLTADHGHAVLGRAVAADRVNVATHRKVADATRRLWGRTPPEATKHERMAATRARRRAEREGWPPLMAWDEGTGPHGIDNPDATPHPWQRSTRRLTVAADVAEAAETGASLASLQTRFGLGAHGVEAALRRAGRPDLWQKVRPARLDGQETSMKEAS